LFEAGVAMMGQRLRRTNPTATDAEIERMLEEWLSSGNDGDLDPLPGRS
jgi:hypothetical protein